MFWITKFSEITQCNGHYAVQGHSRSPILVPMKAHMRLNTNFYLLSCTVTKLWLIIVIRCNNANSGILRHSRSFMSSLVPSESSCDFLLVINTNLPAILHRFRDPSIGPKSLYIWLPLLHLTPSPAEGFPWYDIRTILPGYQWMVKAWYILTMGQGNNYKKLIRRWDSERELFVRRHNVHVLQNTI